MQLQQFDKKKLTSVEKEMRQTAGEGEEEAEVAKKYLSIVFESLFFSFKVSTE
jgi:hypothetical protein